MNAPLYIKAHELCGWVLRHTGGWGEFSEGTLGRLTSETACELVCSVSLALTFPATRSAHLEALDQSIVRLRTLLRLASDQGLLRENSLRHAAGELRAIGKMTGGWRKREKSRASGGGSPAATGA